MRMGPVPPEASPPLSFLARASLHAGGAAGCRAGGSAPCPGRRADLSPVVPTELLKWKVPHSSNHSRISSLWPLLFFSSFTQG